jgi:ribonuclease H / adenosylcobalamin/alpha-ribazole phosphatase
MTGVLLVRHAHTNALGKSLSGRHDVPLSFLGNRQAVALGQALAPLPIAAVYSSPLARALRTAAAIAHPHHIEVAIDDRLNEVDYGAWTGRTFDQLRDDPLWQRFNERRGAAVIPGGEALDAVAARLRRVVVDAARQHRGGLVAMVSHAEAIRLLVLRAADSDPDDYWRVSIDPASATLLIVDGGTIDVRVCNDTDAARCRAAWQCAGAAEAAAAVREPA